MTEDFDGVVVLHVEGLWGVRLLDPIPVEDKPDRGLDELLPVAVGVHQLPEGRALLDLELDHLPVLTDHFQVELLGFVVLSHHGSRMITRDVKRFELEIFAVGKRSVGWLVVG